MGVFAVFVVAPTANGLFAATTRAADRGEAGKIGLPGGKVDTGESLVSAALRESAEEGWLITGLESEPFHVANVEGKPVAWFRATGATPLLEFKEKGRIQPVAVDKAAIAQSGYGNDVMILNYQGDKCNPTAVLT